MSLMDQRSFDAAEGIDVTLPNWQVTLNQMLADSEMITDPNALNPLSFHEQNDLALAAGGDNEVMATAHTIGQSADRRKDDVARNAKIVMQAQGSSIANLKIDISQLSLSSDEVSIGPGGILQIDGRDATLEEKMVLEENSQACSIGVTQTELDIEEFLAGDTNEVPQALQDMAEERGIDNPTMDDYQNMVREEFPIHISSRMISGGINVSDPSSLLPPLASDFAVATTDGPMSTPDMGNSLAGLSGDQLLPPQGNLPQSTPAPMPGG